MMKTLYKIFPLVLLTLLVTSCGQKVVSFSPTTTSSNTPTVASSATVTTTSTISSTTPSILITFNFDNDLPATKLSTPFTLTAGGMTAHFSSPTDPAAFSVQSYSTTFYQLSQLFGNYLYPNRINKDRLNIQFSHPLTGFTCTFATTDLHAVGEVNTPSSLKLTAFQDSAGIKVLNSVTAQGIFSSDLYPEGTLSFDANGQRFNFVTVELVLPNRTATGFLLDNIKIVATKE
jgi:hypothetical protein